MRSKWVNDIHIFPSSFSSPPHQRFMIVLKVSVFFFYSFIPSFISTRFSERREISVEMEEKMWIMIDLWAFFHCCNNAEKK